MSKRTIKISIKLPNGVVATKDLADKATAAAKSVVNESIQDLSEAVELAKDLAKKGINITAEELLDRKSKTRKSGRGRKSASTAAPKQKAKSGARTRVVLDDAQKAEMVEDLKAGAKVADAAEKYGVSTATVMNIKSAAGLTKSRK